MEGKNINTALILAGGLGTRLRSVVKDKPKPMAEVAGKPFLAYLIDQLQFYKIQMIIICAGYKHPKILDYVRKNYKNLDIDFSIENEPLGTGGAVKLAIENFKIKDNFILLNGDSIYLTNLEKLTNFHLENKSDLTLSLKKIKNPDRYGTVELNLDQRITNFKEKQSMAQGLVNCGVYAIDPRIFKPLETEEKFSFEKDVMESFVKTSKYYGFVDNSYFIDIGLPESYDKAQNELPLEFSKISSK